MLYYTTILEWFSKVYYDMQKDTLMPGGIASLVLDHSFWILQTRHSAWFWLLGQVGYNPSHSDLFYENFHLDMAI